MAWAGDGLAGLKRVGSDLLITHLMSITSWSKTYLNKKRKSHTQNIQYTTHKNPLEKKIYASLSFSSAEISASSSSLETSSVASPWLPLLTEDWAVLVREGSNSAKSVFW